MPTDVTIKTFHYNKTKDEFEERTKQKKVGFNDILIRTTHSGVCFTDVHAKESGCGLGHEGIGYVEAVGAAVSKFNIGDRVGWGWLHTSCGNCTTCLTGYRQYCAQSRGFAYSDTDQGAFSSHRVILANFAYHIPEAVKSIDAAPLMCAGASVFEAVDAAGTKPGDRVGVYGLGGLGHMAVLFASKMGSPVTVLSQREDKAVDAFKLGADEFIFPEQPDKSLHSGKTLQTADPAPTEPYRNISTLLITSNEVPDLTPLFPLLARRATIVLMTIQLKPLQLPYMQFILPGHRLIASTEASQENHVRMLEFAAKHGVKPWVQAFGMDAKGIREAFAELETGRMRYRGVLVREGE
ncbi:hypothetical protein MBLNU230_g6785t1 [Neophaeotheca triangularis]